MKLITVSKTISKTFLFTDLQNNSNLLLVYFSYGPIWNTWFPLIYYRPLNPFFPYFKLIIPCRALLVLIHMGNYLCVYQTSPKQASKLYLYKRNCMIPILYEEKRQLNFEVYAISSVIIQCISNNRTILDNWGL